MKRLSVIYMLTVFLLSGGITGCYSDKGNYDYKDINSVDFKILPEAKDNYYRYKMRTTEGFEQTYTPELTQSMAQNEENLEFLWIKSYVSNNQQFNDTVRTKTLTLYFPAGELMEYRVRFQVTDITTNVSLYESLVMTTVFPYLNSWFVLNGEENNRRISSIENPDSTDYAFTADVYAEMGNAPDFENAVDMLYVSGMRNNLLAPEWLYVVEPDDINALYPFSMQVEKEYNQLLPNIVIETKPKFRYGLEGGIGNTNTILVDENYDFYWTNRNYEGKFQKPQFAKEVKTCRAYKVAKSVEVPYICIWDEEQKKFLYFEMTDKGEVTFVQEEYNDWTDKEVLWLGNDNVDPITVKTRLAMALVHDQKDDTYWTYHFDTDGFKFTRDSIGKLNVDKDSQFATTYAFEDQFFYTVGSKVYLFNVASFESIELYDAGAPITLLKFRTDAKSTLGEKDPYKSMRCLGMAVDKGTEGELHELILSTAGDVEETHVFTGFGPIKDLCFTFINRYQ